MNDLNLKDKNSQPVAKIITLLLQFGGASESSLHTYGKQDLSNGEYVIDEFNLRIEITKNDDNGYWFKILGLGS